ncbi:UNVERIFIED_CONTAM: hypothetical protein FKN15_073266 [Acipenser sinensis]
MFSFLLSSWFLGCLLISCFSVSFQRDQGHYYGYVYFRQVRDKTLKRGYFQKSLVIISRLPYVHFYHSLLKLIAPEYFEKSEPCLEAACSDIERWPAPVPGTALSLPIVGVVVKVRIPACYDKPGTTYIDQSAPQNDAQVSLVLPTIHEVDLFSRCFGPVFFHIQMLWELVLLGESLVVMAPSPAESSETVLALVSCIAPLKYCSDFRPYFTIHDSEFKEYTTRTQAPPSVILGVTNPFFAKTLQHWPHIIRIGNMKQAGDIPKQVKVKKLKNLKTLDSKPGVYSAYKPFLNRDEDIIKQLQKGIQQKRPSAAQNAILRRYFLELTQSFIIPLTPPQLRAFSQEEFMKTLEKTGPQLTSHLKGDWIGLYRYAVLLTGAPGLMLYAVLLTGAPGLMLYAVLLTGAPGLMLYAVLLTGAPGLMLYAVLLTGALGLMLYAVLLTGSWQFLKSPNFDGWFRTRRKEVSQKLEALHLEALCEEDLLLRIQKHTEVETVDLVLKLKDKLVQAERDQLPVKPETLVKLRTHIEAVILALPADLQGILLKPGTP